MRRLLEGIPLARFHGDERGQALIEFVTSCFLLLILVSGVIGFSVPIYDKLVMAGLTRQGSNLASRGTSLTDTVSALLTQGASMNISTQGRIIVTEVAYVNGKPEIMDQAESNSGIQVTSAIGSGLGTTATVPAGAIPVLQAGQTLYVTEVFYALEPITALANLLTLPSTLYEAAYF